MQLRVKRLCADDDALIAAVQALDARCLPGECWSLRAFFEEAAKPSAILLALLDEREEPAGFLLAQRVLDEAELAKIAVCPELRRQGMGDALLSALMILLGADVTVYLEVRQSNRAAVQLYEKHGFVQAGLRKRYYHDPEESAVIMRRDPQKEDVC